MTSGSRPIRKTGSTVDDAFSRHSARRAPERNSWAGRLMRDCSIIIIFTQQITVFVNGESRLMCHFDPGLANCAKYMSGKSFIWLGKSAHSSDFHFPSHCFGQWFHSSNSFNVQTLKNNSYLQSGETQCALYTPTFDSYNYFSTPFNFCFTEFNEIVCRVGVRLGPH